MKNLRFVLFILLTAIFWVSCEEVGPYINMNPPNSIDTTYISADSETPQTKLILIEDFTGVRCPNCPNAAQKIKDLQALYPNRILATALHFKNGFGIPHDSSKYDFRTGAGLYLFTNLPGAKGLPTGAVNRTRHIDGDGNFSILQPYTSWSTYVIEEMAKTSCVNIHLSGNVSDTIYNLKVKLHYTEARTDTQAITIYIVEDDIIDLQTLPDNTVDWFYVHKHVLRSVPTSYNGDDLKASLVVNRVFEKDFKIRIDPSWKKANCSVIAFVHRKGYTLDILQAQKIHLQ